jgi:hypothetical protein
MTVKADPDHFAKEIPAFCPFRQPGCLRVPQTKSRAKNRNLAFIAGGPHSAPELTGQGAPDKFSQAQVLAPGLVGPKLLGLSRNAERQGDAATRQLRSGHVAISIIDSYTLSILNLLAGSFQLGHGRNRAGQRIHSNHDHSSSCPRSGAPGFGRSKTLREQVGRHPGGPLQGGGHEGQASDEREDGQCLYRQSRATLRQIRLSQKEKPKIGSVAIRCPVTRRVNRHPPPRAGY